MEDDKTTQGHIEVVDSYLDIDPVKQAAVDAQNFDGDVNLASGDVMYLIPTPSPDPRGIGIYLDFEEQFVDYSSARSIESLFHQKDGTYISAPDVAE